MIEFRGVCKSFGAKTVLENASFEVGSGEVVFLLGRSGVGKSVSLRAIVGLMELDEGEVRIDGARVNRNDPAGLALIRRRCGYVFQKAALFDSLSVYENIVFGARVHKLFPTEHDLMAAVTLVLQETNLESRCLNQMPSDLSHGMQKRVSIARAILMAPAYMLYDEPTTGQDPISTRSLNKLIRSVSLDLKVTSLVVSHDMESALEIADRILVLDEGKIVANLTPKETLNSALPLLKAFMLDVSEQTRHRVHS